jgi:hypothetical protein
MQTAPPHIKAAQRELGLSPPHQGNSACHHHIKAKSVTNGILRLRLLLLLNDPPRLPCIAIAGVAEIYPVAGLATERLKFSREVSRASAIAFSCIALLLSRRGYGVKCPVPRGAAL